MVASVLPPGVSLRGFQSSSRNFSNIPFRNYCEIFFRVATVFLIILFLFIVSFLARFQSEFLRNRISGDIPPESVDIPPESKERFL